MAQPDIVIDKDHTTVVERVEVGTSRAADPDVRVDPDTSSLELGGGSGASPHGEISLVGAASQSSPSTYDTRISLQAADGSATASAVDVTHQDGPTATVRATSTDSKVTLEDTQSRARLEMYAQPQFSGFETGREPLDPWLQFWRTDQKELRAFPKVTVGSAGERRTARPGVVDLIARTTQGTRKVSVRLDGGVNSQGGTVSVRDRNETENVALRGQRAEVRVGGSAPGSIDIQGDPSDGVTTIRLEGQPSGSAGGRLAMKDASRKTNVELRAASGLLVLGSSSQSSPGAGTFGQINLDDGSGETLAISAQDGTISFDYGSEGTIMEIETNPSSGSKKIRTKYAIKENVSSL